MHPPPANRPGLCTPTHVRSVKSVTTAHQFRSGLSLAKLQTPSGVQASDLLGEGGELLSTPVFCSSLLWLLLPGRKFCTFQG